MGDPTTDPMGVLDGDFVARGCVLKHDFEARPVLGNAGGEEQERSLKTRSGYDKFYGFMGGETNQWAPLLYDGTARVELPNDPNYHFTTDMTNQAIAWVRYEKSLTPDKPFFVYFAPGATHAPHHVPREWADKYKGKFDAGWDKYREETLARQIKLGVVPPGTTLPSRRSIGDQRFQAGTTSSGSSRSNRWPSAGRMSP
jgi:arylsulfatase A-like enzyme